MRAHHKRDRLYRKSDHRTVPERGRILFEDPISRQSHGFAHLVWGVVGEAFNDLGHDFRFVGILNDNFGLRLVNQSDAKQLAFNKMKFKWNKRPKKKKEINRVLAIPG